MKDVLVVGKLKDGMFEKFMGFMQSEQGMAERKKVADVTKTKDCEKLVKHVIKKFGQMDILVCNVGNGNSMEQGSETIKEWKKMLDENFFSAINIINASRKFLKKTNGCIICISSIAGIETTGAPITYSVAKSALISYVKRISKTFADEGIRINTVSPGNILFEGSTWEKKLKQNKSQVHKMLETNVSLKRFGTPEEISNLVVFLASSKSSFTTGANFVIDGGQIKS